MTKKAPPEVLSPSDLAYMSTLNERDRRWFLATKAAFARLVPGAGVRFPSIPSGRGL
ncbi:MAG: hypothetical protein MJY68_07505 [Bacteroidaceae bacterium]|nr:hypothetical protein [Bacteroidaceae bacterium]MCQ2068921.1 hypothetical protein [Bacteroidaceae bacterium]